MIWSNRDNMKVAVLDMYEGFENQGMRCIREILNQFSEYNHLNIQKDEFDVRLKEEVPDTSYDVYICTGGPGSPLESEGSTWEQKFFALLDDLLAYNNNPDNPVKKQVFFICHSFQLVCRYFKVATISKRNSTSFGVFPMHYFNASDEVIFKGLKDPFYGVDSRDYQVTQPCHKLIKDMGGSILAIEKARPHVPYERAIMAIRFNENMIGTQFHPEADPQGMLLHLQTDTRKKTVIENHGLEKWESMIIQLNDPDKIMSTYAHILPNFLNMCVHKLQLQEV
ncbi:MAG: GMP synthase [Ferruginibacter sp.]